MLASGNFQVFKCCQVWKADAHTTASTELNVRQFVRHTILVLDLNQSYDVRCLRLTKCDTGLHRAL